MARKTMGGCIVVFLTHWPQSTKLLCIEPGYYLSADRQTIWVCTGTQSPSSTQSSTTPG